MSNNRTQRELKLVENLEIAVPGGRTLLGNSRTQRELKLERTVQRRPPLERDHWVIIGLKEN